MKKYNKINMFERTIHEKIINILISGVNEWKQLTMSYPKFTICRMRKTSFYSKILSTGNCLYSCNGHISKPRGDTQSLGGNGFRLPVQFYMCIIALLALLDMNVITNHSNTRKSLRKKCIFMVS